MPPAIQPVTLSSDQVNDLTQKVATLRHDINNNLTLIMASIELIKYKPEMAEKMITTMNEQPMKISNTLRKFSEEFEAAMGIIREK